MGVVKSFSVSFSNRCTSQPKENEYEEIGVGEEEFLIFCLTRN